MTLQPDERRVIETLTCANSNDLSMYKPMSDDPLPQAVAFD